MTFRFLHLADLHLDSAYGGREATRKRLRAATMQALRRAVSFAIESRLDAVLIAGDAFDDGRLGYDARSCFRREVRRLADAGVTVALATGNHDPGGAGGTWSGLDLAGSAGASTAQNDGLAPVLVALDASPTTWTITRQGHPVGTLTAAGHATSQVTDDLASAMRPPSGELLPHVAMLHTQVGSARGADGHASYAPSTIERLRASGFVYWALGHVHIRGRVDPTVPAWYSGNLQGRNPREHGPKGGLVVEVDASGLARPPEFVAFAPIEFLNVRIDAPNAEGGWTGEADHLAPRIARAIGRALSERGAAGAPDALVARVFLHGTLPHAFRQRLKQDHERSMLEDALMEEPTLAGLDCELLELQLRVHTGVDPDPEAATESVSLVDLEHEILTAPSALREAIHLADELQARPEAALDWPSRGAVDWSTGEQSIERLAALTSDPHGSIAGELLERMAAMLSEEDRS